MIYSVDHITTMEDCNALISAANLNKSKLIGKKADEAETYTQYTTSSSIDASIAGLTTMVGALQAVYDAETDINKKLKAQLELQRKQLTLTQLQTRREKYGTQALLQKEFGMTCIDQQLAENDAYIAALEERKGKL